MAWEVMVEPMGVKRDPEPDERYLERLGRNLWLWLTNQPTDPTFRMRCALCDEKKQMFNGIQHRGIPRRTNLICDECWAKDNNSHFPRLDVR